MKPERSTPRKDSRTRIYGMSSIVLRCMRKIIHTKLYIAAYLFLAHLVYCATAQSCDDREFYDGTDCVKCHDSCLSCTNSTSCTECTDYMMFNQTSGLCEFCDDGYFYDSTLVQCTDCQGVCSKKCAYQDSCFDCATGEYYDLFSKKCVTECKISSSSGYSEIYALNSTQFGSRAICRGNNYYVDSSSQSIIELGTKEYPYKNVGLVFAEVLNFHANSNRTITVYLKGNTTDYIQLNANYIINMTLNIYSDSGQATLIGKDSAVTMLTDANSCPQYSCGRLHSLFNILQTSARDAIDMSRMNSLELYQLSSAATIFYVNRASFTIDGVDFYSDYSSTSDAMNIVTSIWNPDKVTTMTNMFIRTQGGIYRNIMVGDNLIVENITSDQYMAGYGFESAVQCNYPEAIMENEHIYKNVYAYNSQDRSYGITGAFIGAYGNANYTIENATIAIYATYSDAIAPITLFLNPSCIPQDDLVQIFSVSNSYFTMPSNPSYERANVVYSSMTTGTTRTYNLYYTGLTFEHIYMSFYFIILNLGMVGQNFYIKDLTINNVTTQEGMILSAEVGGNVYIENVLYQNSIQTGARCLTLGQNNLVDIKNMTFSNVHAYDDKPWLIINLFGFNATVDGFTMINSSVNSQPAIFVDEDIAVFRLKNSHFENLQVASDNSLVKIYSSTAVQIDNSTFTNVTGYSSSSSNNYMIEIQSINLTTSEDSWVQNTTATNSMLGFLKVGDFRLNTTVPRTLEIADLTYSDSEIYFSPSLVLLEEIYTQQDVYIKFTNLEFRDISFVGGGKIMNFQQQMANAVTVTNLKVDNVTGCSILVEAFNKQSLDSPSLVHIYSMTTDNINSEFDSLLMINQGGQLEIYDSHFKNIYCYEEGAVLFAGYKQTTVMIYNTTFENNTAIEGSNFQIQDQSVVKCYECTFRNNFAVEAGVIKANEDGYFELYDSVIENNYALSYSVFEIFNSAKETIVSNCTISNNQVLTSEELLREINVECGKLCFLSENYIQYINENPEVLSIIVSEYSFGSIIGTYSVLSNTVFNEQDYIIDAFSTTIAITDCEFSAASPEHPGLLFTSSTVSLSATSFSNITSPVASFIQSTLETTFLATDLNYTLSSGPLLAFRTSDQVSLISGVQIFEVSSEHSLVSLASLSQTSVTNMRITNVIISEPALSIKNSKLSDLSIICESVSHLCVHVVSSVLDTSTLNVKQGYGGVSIEYSSKVTITESQFEQLGSADFKQGAGVRAADSNVTITNSSFISNSAQQGAAIAMLCEGVVCAFEVRDSTFASNQAIVSGGAIYYDLYRPVLKGNSFSDNQAEYGQNIASYPVRVKIYGSDTNEIYLNNIGSGIQYEQELRLALVDYDDQVYIIDSSSQIAIRSVSTGTKVLGIAEARVVEGVSTFSNLIFVSSPGAENVSFTVSSKGIDTSTARTVYSSHDNISYVQDDLVIDFRYCKPGEKQSGNKCDVCSAGTYSFDWNSTTCEQCMNDAVCLGGLEVSVNSGFWRASYNTSTIVECLNEDACLGGYIDTGEYPVTCAKGYSGVLCGECVINDDEKYERTAGFICSKCPDPVLNILRLIGIFLLVLIFLCLLIAVNLRKKKESEMSILMRIMTNYLQIMSVALSYNISFPGIITTIFAPLDKIGSSSESFVSFDCFLQDAELKAFTPSAAFFKVFLTGILPFMMIAGVVLIWLILKLILRKRIFDLKRNIIVSSITILILLFPTIVKASLNLFQCTKIDDGEERVTQDLNMECYSKQHLDWLVFLAAPMLIGSIGLILCALFILVKNRNHLDTTNVQRYYLIMYQGLKKDRYYWEIVNTVRKFLIVSANALMGTASMYYKAVVGCAICISLERLQDKLQPFKNEDNNYIENLEMTSSMSTFFFGLIFVSEGDKVTLINDIAFFVLLGINLRFILMWFYFMLRIYRRFKIIDKIAQLLSVTLCLSKKHKDRLNYEDTLKSQQSISISRKVKVKVAAKSCKKRYKKKTKHTLKAKLGKYSRDEPHYVDDETMRRLNHSSGRSNLESVEEVKRISRRKTKKIKKKNNTGQLPDDHFSISLNQPHLNSNEDQVLVESDRAVGMKDFQSKKNQRLEEIKYFESILERASENPSSGRTYNKRGQDEDDIDYVEVWKKDPVNNAIDLNKDPDNKMDIYKVFKLKNNESYDFTDILEDSNKVLKQSSSSSNRIGKALMEYDKMSSAPVKLQKKGDLDQQSDSS